MRPIAFVTLSLLATAVPLSGAAARGQEKSEASETRSQRPITDRQPDAADVATTPLNDLNLRKDAIPPLLIAAQASPYDASGMTRCPAISAAIVDLDRVLGDDLDLPHREEDRVSAGKIAQSLVGKFIPFRSVIRELSGANAHERKIDDAIEAGMARRAFLKGLGQAKGCRYPARAATPQAIAARAAATAAVNGMEPAAHTRTMKPTRAKSERDEMAAAYARAEQERKDAEKARSVRPHRR